MCKFKQFATQKLSIAGGFFQNKTSMFRNQLTKGIRFGILKKDLGYYYGVFPL